MDQKCEPQSPGDHAPVDQKWLDHAGSSQEPEPSQVGDVHTAGPQVRLAHELPDHPSAAIRWPSHTPPFQAVRAADCPAQPELLNGPKMVCWPCRVTLLRITLLVPRDASSCPLPSDRVHCCGCQAGL